MLSKKIGPPVPPRPKPSTIPLKRIPPIYKTSSCIINDSNNSNQLIVNANNSCNTSFERTHNYDNISITTNNENGDFLNHKNHCNHNNVDNLSIKNYAKHVCQTDNNNQIDEIQTVEQNNKLPIATPRHNLPNIKQQSEPNNSDDYVNVNVQSSSSSSNNNETAQQKNEPNNSDDYVNVNVQSSSSSSNNNDSSKDDQKIIILNDDHSCDELPKYYQTTKTIQLKQSKSNNNVDHSLSCSNLEKLSVNFDDSSRNDKTTVDKKVTFHEMLISELTEMRKVALPKKRRKQSLSPISLVEDNDSNKRKSLYDDNDNSSSSDVAQNKMQSLCMSNFDDSGLEDEDRVEDIHLSKQKQNYKDKMKKMEKRMSLPGLPPLPKSLSGLDLVSLTQNNISSTGFSTMATPSAPSYDLYQNGSSSSSRKLSTLDTQLATLRNEMFGLRQLDLSLLSQLWALNESIQEFRTIIQEQDAISPPSPSPTASDTNSLSSEDEINSQTQENPKIIAAMKIQQQKHQLFLQQQQQQQQQQQLQQNLQQQRMRSAPPPPPPNRKAPSRPV